LTERLLITGASGFVGRAVLDQHIDEFDVHAVARSVPSDAPTVVEWHAFDLLERDPATLVDAVRPSHLMHLAWIATPGVYRTAPENERWLEASNQLVETFVAAGGRRVVATGTCMEYDLTTAPSREQTPSHPNSPYARCKDALFREVSVASERAGFEFVWARLFYLYGLREKPGRLVSSLVARLLAGEPATVAAGSLKRDYLHVHDVARALLHLVRHETTGPVNVGSGRAEPLSSIGRMVAEACSATDLLTVEDRRGEGPDAVPEIVADVTKLSSTGWTPRMTLEEGIPRTVDWWRRNEAAG